MEPHHPKSSRRYFANIVGAVLVGFGSFVMYQVLVKLRDFIEAPENLKVFLALVPEDPLLRTMVVGEQSIVLPVIAFHYAAYFICIFLLFLAALVGGRLLINGISLIVP
ncbi:MAG: hypothetical protein J5J00_01510 [Deltaproteobacteria bacterium]|nr:hypothetical protein [Deltaproteobacteria bacterium]